MPEKADTDNIRQFLSQAQSFEVLEDQLDRSTQEYLGIKKIEKTLDYGPRLTDDSFNRLFAKVAGETNDFLQLAYVKRPLVTRFYLPYFIKRGITIGTVAGGVIFVSNPIKTGSIPELLVISAGFGIIAGGLAFSFAYDYSSSHLNLRTNIINIGTDRFAKLPAPIAHEYTHHIQKLSAPKLSRPLMEGHALGVGSTIARRYAERYDNPAFVYSTAQWTARYLKDAYLDICGQTDRKPRASLVNTDVEQLSRTIGPIMKHHPSHYYCLGRAFTTVSEALHGPGIYQKILKDKFNIYENI